MLMQFGNRLRSPVALNPVHCKRPCFVQTLKMASTEAKPKRLICPFCSKPARICLCNRIQNPGLENSVSVTILQHSLERNHPLNSTRIAKIGLKNVTVAIVSDVNFEARFDIRLLEPGQKAGSPQVVLGTEDFDQDLGTGESPNGFGLERGNEVGLGFKRFKKCPGEKNSSLIDSREECGLSNGTSDMLDGKVHLEGSNILKIFYLSKRNVLVSEEENGSSIDEGNAENGAFVLETSGRDLFRRQTSLGPVFSQPSSAGNSNISREDKILQPDLRRLEEPSVMVNIGKYGVINDLAHHWMPANDQKPNFDQILASQVASDALSKGLVVKKMQKRQLSGSTKLKEYEEFELEVSPGSVLLFPSERAISVEDLQVKNIEVKNLIVLDGTWAKAKRIYNENPWLKLLPHLKLDMDKMSLYSEVRHQPKAGYLSTIESIVYALKALGENSEGLDNLLDVFESMIRDQRRCKDERLSKDSPL